MTRKKAQQIPPTMRVFAIDRFSDLGSIRELLTPNIGADEILVRVCAARINSIDREIRDGIKPISNVHFPLILG